MDNILAIIMLLNTNLYGSDMSPRSSKGAITTDTMITTIPEKSCFFSTSKATWGLKSFSGGFKEIQKI